MTPPVALSLTVDGALGITIDEPVRDLTARWLPRALSLHSASAPPRASIHVRDAGGDVPVPPATMPTLTIGPVRGWMSDRYLILRGEHAGGDVDLTSGRAVLRAPSDRSESEADVYGMLTIAAGVLLAGLSRALIHGAAVAPPGPSGAWMLVGDSQSGKSTTCATLCRAGWSYLSDDQVILSAAQRGVTVEGWVRPFHLDSGWERGQRSGQRESQDPEGLFPGARLTTSALAGVLLPHVSPKQSTALAPADPAEALAELVRQSPWVLLDRGAAPVLLDLLAGAASRLRPPQRLTLGKDSYASPERMARVVTGLVS